MRFFKISLKSAKISTEVVGTLGLYSQQVFPSRVLNDSKSGSQPIGPFDKPVAFASPDEEKKQFGPRIPHLKIAAKPR
jgi:hypothetical protein